MKKWIFIIILISIACQKNRQMLIEGLQIPADFYKTKTYNYVLEIGEGNKVLIFKGNKKIDEIVLPQDYFVKKILANPNHEVILLLPHQISIFKGHKEISSFNLDFPSHNMAFWRKDILIVLGLKDDFIFHLFTLKGDFIKSFGKFPEEIDPQIGPRDFWIEGDTIYVAAINQYKIYRYINGKLMDYFEHPDLCYIRGPIKEREGGISKVYLLSGINGLVSFKDRLYVSTFKHELIRGWKSVFGLDIFHKNSGELLQHATYDSVIVPVYADINYLYLICGSSIIKRRR